MAPMHTQETCIAAVSGSCVRDADQYRAMLTVLQDMQRHGMPATLASAALSRVCERCAWVRETT